MSRILSADEYRRELVRIGEVVDLEKCLPDYIFRDRFDVIRVIEFDVLVSKRFKNGIDRLADKAGAVSCSLMVLEPGIDYYFDHFNRAPAVEFAKSDSPEDYLRALHKDPGSSPADSLATRMDRVVIYPPSIQWICYGERELEIAILATHPSLRNSLEDAFEEPILHTVPKALEVIFSSGIPDLTAEERSRLLQNYGEDVA